jgi:hypothetical protein
LRRGLYLTPNLTPKIKALRTAVTVIALGRSEARRFLAAQAMGGRLIAINQSIKQEGVFITEEQGRTIECTE